MKNEVSFEYIAKDILENKKFQKISLETHHGITRMEHSLRVARSVYKIAKKLKMDYVSATRAAILHDFFTNKEFGSHRGLIQGVVHPDIALANAKGEFAINDIEANAIEAHMFPLSKVVPKYKESWLLTAVDKGIAIYEQALYKFSYKKVTSKIGYAISLMGILAFNILTMEHK